MKKAAILRGRKHFTHVVRSGQTVESGLLTCRYATLAPDKVRGKRVRVGFRVTSKLKAVRRNRLKRLMREAMRLEYTSFETSFPAHISAIGMILSVKAEAALSGKLITFEQVRNDVRAVCRRIAQRLGGQK